MKTVGRCMKTLGSCRKLEDLQDASLCEKKHRVTKERPTGNAQGPHGGKSGMMGTIGLEAGKYTFLYVAVILLLLLFNKNSATM